MSIDTKYSKEQDYEVVAHVINKLPDIFLELITLVEGLSTTNTLVELKSKVRACLHSLKTRITRQVTN